MDSSTSTLQFTTVILAIVFVLTSTIAIAAIFSGSVQAGEDITLSDSSTTMETLRIVDYEFTTRDIPEDGDAKLKIVLQNTGSDLAEGTFSLTSSPDGTGTVDISPSSVNYSVEPGSRQTFVFEITGNDNGIDSRQFVDLNLQINSASGNSVTIDDPTPKNPNYPEDGASSEPTDDPFSVYVLPKGASVSEGTISPTGERQAITKAFTSYKDNSAGTLGSFTNSIPPTTLSGGTFTNTSQGAIYNFLDSTGASDGAYSRIESTTDGNIKVGIASRNIPDSQHYTLQLRYQFITSVLDEAKINIVAQDGTEIDRDTTYILSEKGTKETRYFQLSKKESNWVRENNSVFLTIENTDLNTQNEVMAVYFAQILSTDNPLEITTPNIQITGADVLEPDGSDSIDNTFATEEVYQIEYTVENTGSRAGTKVVSLNEGGTIVKQESIDLNPGEIGTVTFSVNRGESGLYRYNNPAGDLSSNMNVYIEGGEALPPIATISLPPEPNIYPNDTLAVDPKNPQMMELTADDSLAPNSSIAEYQWTFEWSGNTVTTTNPSIQVMSPGTQGNYDVTLTVVNDEGVTDVTQQTVRAGTIGPVAPNRDDISIGTGDSVLLDASGASHPVGILPNRCITEYRWELSDGTVLGTNTGTCVSPPATTADHTFMNSGTFDVELVVVDDMGNTDSSLRQIEVDAPEPDAAIQVGKSERLVDKTFTFDASNSYTNEGSIVEYQWEMGDGSTYTTTDPTVDHAYSEEGLYSPTVTVVNDLGGTSSSTTNVSVISEPFNVGINGPSSGDTSDVLTFDNGATDGRDNVQEWTWNMGDGTTYTGNDVLTHTFGSAGTYQVSLTGRTDEYGGFTDTQTLTVNISTAPPVPVIQASYGNGSTVYISDAITFDGSGSYDPDGTNLSYNWNLAGQTDSSEIVNDFEFNNLGSQQVTLTVTDASGASASETYDYTVDARSPQASFTYSPQNPGPQEPTEFDATSSKHREPKGEIVEYRWNFKHTNQTVDATGSVVNQSFPQNNQKYEVELTVEDQWGYTDTVTKSVKTDAYRSCHEFLRERPETQSGNYQLDPLGTNNTIEVYCNMDYDGGGWTVIDKEAFYKFSEQIGNTTDRGGDIRDWDVSPTDVYSYDGGGDHYFIYWIDTGFGFSEVRTDEITFGSASYRGGGATSEVRGDNEAKGDWQDLNSGGVSGDIAIGTKDSVFDSWSSHRGVAWDRSWQWTGSPGVQLSHPEPGVQRFHFRDVTYNKSASSIGVGWGESGGQVEGWEWEKGEFMVRQPVEEPDYFYNQGNNIENFGLTTSTGMGNTTFGNTQIEMWSRNTDSERVIQSDSINLANHDSIYIGYVLTVEDGGSGYVEMEAGGKTVRDSINDTYGVNDRSMELDVSNINQYSDITVTVHTNNRDTTTTLEVDRVWGQGEGSGVAQTTAYNTDFRNGLDDWYTPSSNTLTTSANWARPICSSSYLSNNLQKNLTDNIYAEQVRYNAQVSAVDSWDSGEALSLQIRDDSGWTTVESTSDTVYFVNNHDAYDCHSGNDWGEKKFTWSGTFNVDGSVQGVRVNGTHDQDDDDESIAVNYVDISPVNYTNWNNKLAIDVNNPNSEDLTNHQVRVEVPYKSGMNSDFSDLRFGQGGQKIDYWIESKSNGNSATVWVEVPYLKSNSESTIYAYYNNGTVSSQSDGNATFQHFDDFNTDTSAEWDYGQLLTDRGSGFRFAWDPANSYVQTDSSNSDFYNVKDSTKSDSNLDTNGFIAETRARTDDDDRIGVSIEASGSSYDLYGVTASSGPGESMRGWNGTSDSTLVDYGSVVAGSGSTPYTVVGIRYDGNSKLEGAYNRYVQASSYTENGLSIDNAGLISIANSPSAYYDWFIVRNYAETQPATEVKPETLQN